MKYTLIISMALTLHSCATYHPPPEMFPPDYTGPAFIEGSPWATVVGGGSSHHIFAKVMDKYRNPMPGQIVTATFDYEDEPIAYLYDNQAVTDENGVAEFYLVGIGFPGYTTLTLTSGGVSTRVYVWTLGYGPFQR